MAPRAWMSSSAVALWALMALACSGRTETAPRRSAGEGGVCADCSPSAEAGAPGEAGAGAPAAAGGGPSAGEGGSDGEGSPPPLELRAISISQTHELRLMAGGEAVEASARPVPLIATKRALVRAFVDVEPGASLGPLKGVLDLKSSTGTSAIVSERFLNGSSLQDDLASTFVFDVPASELLADTSYRVRVLGAENVEVTRYPSAGLAPLDAKRATPLELVLVPLVIGENAPKIENVQIDALRARLLALYPLSDVAISIADRVKLGYAVDAEGNGWDEALDDLYTYRAAADPADNVFFYGMMAPDTSFASYCQTSCVLGYSVVADPDDVVSRGSVGITVFADGSGASEAWNTVAHELGHALGREHSNCGLDLGNPSDPSAYDTEYPYPDAGMGQTYGFDFATMRLVKPRSFRDVMSYCSPVWIADYTYRALDERLRYIEAKRFRVLDAAAPTLVRVARIRRDGSSRWLWERLWRAPERAPAQTLPLLDAAGQEVGAVLARVARLDHARGGYVSIPASPLASAHGAVAVDLRPLGGEILQL